MAAIDPHPYAYNLKVEYVAIRNIRDGLTGLTAEEAVSISKGLAELEALAEKDNPTASALVRLLRHLGF